MRHTHTQTSHDEGRLLGRSRKHICAIARKKERTVGTSAATDKRTAPTDPGSMDDEIEQRRDAMATATVHRLCHASCIEGERAKQRQQPAFVDHCVDLWRAQRGLCALTGVPMTLDLSQHRPTEVSIDRLDNGKGYLVGNVRLTAHWANHAAACYGAEVFKTYMRALRTPPSHEEQAVRLQPPEDLSLRPQTAARRRGQGPFQFLVHLCVSTRQYTREKTEQTRKREFVLHVVQLLAEQGMTCALTGVELTFATPGDPRQMSIIRVDQDKGWVVGNVVVVSVWVANAFSMYGAAASLDFLDGCTLC